MGVRHRKYIPFLALMRSSRHPHVSDGVTERAGDLLTYVFSDFELSRLFTFSLILTFDFLLSQLLTFEVSSHRPYENLFLVL